MSNKDSILNMLYYGGIAPWSKGRLPLSKEYEELMNRACDMQEEIITLLNDEGKKLLENFLDASVEIGGYFEEEKFKDGFILGTRLMIETLQDKRLKK